MRIRFRNTSQTIMAAMENLHGQGIDAGVRACQTAHALEIRCTLQRGVACATRGARFAAAESSIREHMLSGSADNLSVVSETFAQAGKGRSH